MSNKPSPQTILMYIYAAVIGMVSSFGTFMFIAWLGVFDRTVDTPWFYTPTIAKWLFCFVVYIVFMVLWVIALVRQERKLMAAGISVLIAAGGLALGFIGFLFYSAMAIMS